MPQDTHVPEVEAARAEGGEMLLRAQAEVRRVAERGERRLGRLREAVARRARAKGPLPTARGGLDRSPEA